MITLRQHLDHAAERAREIFNRVGYIKPMVHAIDADNQHHIILLDMNDKDEGVRRLRLFARMKNVQQLVFIAEAWVTKCNVGQPRQRLEAIIFQGENQTECMSAEIEIRREGERAELGETNVLPITTLSSGRFVDLLKNKSMH